MTNSKNTKRALLASVLSMMLCLAMLIGSTFAWFTDSVTSGKNRIVAGNLDVELYYKNASTSDWENASEVSTANPTFFVDKDGKAILWEPGVMAVTQFKVANVGSLALKYSLATLKADFNAMAGHDLSEVIKFAVIDNDQYTADSTRESILALNPTFDDFTGFTAEGHLLPADKATGDEPSAETFTVVAYWAPNANDVDNLYNVNNGQKTDDNADQLYINIEIRLNAAQYTYEKDSFDENYDADAEYPEVAGGDESWYVEGENTLTISTAAHLVDLAKRVNEGESFAGKTITLKNDIVLDKSSNWVPIGIEGNAFNGTFDGDNKTVSNLFYDQKKSEGLNAVGLFGVVGNATIKNLTVEGEIVASVKGIGTYSCGGVCGYAAGSATIENCKNKVTINCTDISEDSIAEVAVGGILGGATLSSGFKTTINSCTNEANITVGKESISAQCFAGGIAALTDGTALVTDTQCFNKGIVTVSGDMSFKDDIVVNLENLFA